MDNVEHIVNAGCLYTVAFHSVFLIYKSANLIQALFENVQGGPQCRKRAYLHNATDEVEMSHDEYLSVTIH